MNLFHDRSRSLGHQLKAADFGDHLHGLTFFHILADFLDHIFRLSQRQLAKESLFNCSL